MKILTKVSLTTALVLTLGTTPLLAQTATGTNSNGNYVERTYGSYIANPAVVNEYSAPMLNSFWFGYTNPDHEFYNLYLLPGGGSIDLSPAAQNSHREISKGKLGLRFGDSGLDDSYRYEIRHRSVQGAPTERYQLRDVGCTGSCTRQLPNIPENSEFALVGFSLYFTGGRDHDLDQLAIYEENGLLNVVLNDKNNDDVFGYLVEYTWLSRDMYSITNKSESGRITENGGFQKNLSDTSSVRSISGFSFDFLSGDHEVKDIGVLLKDNTLKVLYGDKNGDDDADWHVSWLESRMKLGVAMNPEIRIGNTKEP